MILSLFSQSVKLRSLLLAIHLLTSLIAFCQVREIRNAPSPEVANLGTFGTIPVGLYTGTPNISVPLYTMSVGKLSIPIEAIYIESYNSLENVAEDILQAVGLAPQYSWAVSNARK